MNAEAILGDIDDSKFTGRRRHYVDIGWGDATKQRQLATADSGAEVRIRLPRGTFLADGAVIADDGEQVVVVRRPPEPAITVRFDQNSQRSMLLLGYVLGNQHAPIDVDHDTLSAPLFTSAHAAEHLLADLGVVGKVADIPLARAGWSRTSADHHGGHSHD
ncbi:MAG: urease accessory protein UreE [Mycobacterium sp.]